MPIKFIVFCYRIFTNITTNSFTSWHFINNFSVNKINSLAEISWIHKPLIVKIIASRLDFYLEVPLSISLIQDIFVALD